MNYIKNRKLYQFSKIFAAKLLDFVYMISSIGQKNPQVVNIDETINKIISEKVSVSRYGDGELRWMIGASPNYKFQDINDEISNRLKEVLVSDVNNHIVCIPDVFSSQDEFVFQNKVTWQRLLIKYRKKWMKCINVEKKYYDSNVTRFYIDRVNKSAAGARFEVIKKIWNDRDILIVEGSETRLGVNNDLVSNATSISRLICPSENAFERYNEICTRITEIHNVENYLVLIALGPTATILAHDLALLNIQAIDIGHLDLEYDWYKKGVSKRVVINGKYVNEVSEGYKVSNIFDGQESYMRQIIDIIK